MMQLPSDQEIAEAKALALKSFGSDAVERVEIDDPVERAVLMAPFDEKGWAEYTDALHRDLLTAHAQVFAQRVLWPSLTEAHALRMAYPAVPSLVTRRLAAAAGETPERALVRKLATDRLPMGLTAEEAEALKAQHAGAVLWAVDLPSQELACVMRQPLPDVYLAAAMADRDARAKGEKVIEAMGPFLGEAVVWPAPAAVKAMLARRPALIGDLRSAFLRMGGEGAQVRSKRL